MEDRAKRRARLFTIVGFILALGAAGGTYFYASSAQVAAPPEEAKVDVVVATRDLQARQQIQASDVTIAKYPVAVAPASAASDPQDVIGRILTAPVGRNEPLTPNRWSVAQGQNAFTVFPPGQEPTPDSPHYRALSISVADANAVGGNLVPGDIVDLIATINLDPNKYFNPPPPAQADPTRVLDFQTKVIYESVSILARTGTVYTIRVPSLENAQQLYYLQASGAQIAIILRAALDERTPTTAGTSFPNIYQTFGYQIVRRINP